MTLWQFEKKLWRKSALYGLGMGAYVYFLVFIVNHFTGEGGNPLVFSIFAFLIGASTPLIMKAFSRPTEQRHSSTNGRTTCLKKQETI